MTTIDQLRRISADETRANYERQTAAEHSVKLQVQQVTEQEIGDHDPDVIQKLENNAALMEIGWQLKMTVQEAKATVAAKRRDRKLYAIVADESISALERLAAIRVILDGLHPRSFLRMNNYTAERLLQSIRPSDSTRFYPGGERRAVARPPLELADLWDA